MSGLHKHKGWIYPLLKSKRLWPENPTITKKTNPGHHKEESKNDNVHDIQKPTKVKQPALFPSKMIAKLERTQICKTKTQH